MVKTNKINETDIDEKVMHILEPMFEFGLFDRKETGKIDANVKREHDPNIGLYCMSFNN